jgi:hypothetical protein
MCPIAKTKFIRNVTNVDQLIRHRGLAKIEVIASQPGPYIPVRENTVHVAPRQIAQIPASIFSLSVHRRCRGPMRDFEEVSGLGLQVESATTTEVHCPYCMTAFAKVSLLGSHLMRKVCAESREADAQAQAEVAIDEVPTTVQSPVAPIPPSAPKAVTTPEPVRQSASPATGSVDVAGPAQPVAAKPVTP